MKTLLTLTFAAIALSAAAQDIFAIGAIDSKKLDLIESGYVSAIDSRPEMQSVFPNQEAAVTKNWEILQNSFRSYLTAQNFNFTAGTRFFIRYYFEKDGTVQYVGYKIHSAIDKKTQEAFELHLKNFARQANFGMEGSKAYAQCGTVTF